MDRCCISNPFIISLLLRSSRLSNPGVIQLAELVLGGHHPGLVETVGQLDSWSLK